ncbi:hypothetical protein CDAR_387001 [Caerostris darwini]|uniref:UBZ4-type domain-containing protein n=1 Tax=Caerostris darwini TaxID=1538125 RepID=A0AAV4WMK7_9ARAC|nr:hypothetical protein CDAR_387001 [Caerostris darwini]
MAVTSINSELVDNGESLLFHTVFEENFRSNPDDIWLAIMRFCVFHKSPDFDEMDVFETNLTVEKEASKKKIENLTQELNELRAIVSLNSACGSDIDYAYEAVTAKEEPKVDCTKSDIRLCPICHLGFSDMHTLELHVNNCLDKAMG